MRHALSVLILVTLLVAGCSSQTTKPAPKAQSVSLVFPVVAEPKTLSPDFAADTGAYYPTSNIYSHLVTMDWGVVKGTAAYGDLAESWTTSPDGLTYTFKLFKNVKWTDGVPLTSADVKFTYDKMIEKKYPYAAYLSGITQIKTPDDYTVVFQLKEPNMALVPMMAQAAGWTGKIYPKHIWEKVDGFDKGDYVNSPVGSGPYKLKEWVKGSYITLEANPDYFRGKPPIDTLVFKFMADANVVKADFLAGNLNIMPYDYAPPYAEVDSLKKQKGVQIVYTPSIYSRDIQLNVRTGPLSNLKVRRAIAYAVDRDQISKQAFAGVWAPAYNASVDTQGKWINKDAKFPAFDKAKAEALLDEAGFKKGADGWRFGLSVTNPIYTDSKSIAEVLVQQLKAVGINAKWDQYDMATWFTKIRKGEFDISVYFTRYGPDPDAYAEHFATGGARNFMGYSNPELDALVKKAKRTVVEADRIKLYQQVQAILVRDMPYINLVNETKLSLVREGWDGFNIQEKGYDKSISWFGFYAVIPPKR